MEVAAASKLSGENVQVGTCEALRKTSREVETTASRAQ